MRALARVLAALLCALLTTTAIAQTPPETCTSPTLSPPGGELEIFVVTMSPGGEIWSRFGHNGLWIRKPGRGAGVVFNFGVFEASPDMLAQWLEGRQNYWLGTRTYESMIALYASEDRDITAQRLHLPPEMAMAMVQRLGVLAEPENRTYRYHWSLANCSTKIRDLLDEITKGDLSKQHQEETGMSIRDEVLRHIGEVLPMWFALQLLAGVRPGEILTWWQSMFLPVRVRERLAVSTLVWPDGERRPLVAYECEVLSSGVYGPPPASAPERDGLLWLIGLALGGIGLGLGVWTRRANWRPLARAALGGYVALSGLLLGALGLLSFLLWHFSALVAFSDNENAVLVHPLHLLWIAAGVLVIMGRPRGTRVAWWMVAVLAGFAALGTVVNLFLPQPSFGVAGAILPLELGLAAALWIARRPDPPVISGSQDALDGAADQ